MQFLNNAAHPVVPSTRRIAVTQNETNLKLISPASTTENSDVLFTIAKELMGDQVSLEVLDEPGVREMLTQVQEKREAEKAEREAAEKQKVIADQAQALRKKVNAVLHPIGAPKEKAILIHKEELASLLPASSGLNAEREKLFEQYRTKVPNIVFESKAHAFSFRGFFLGVKMGFNADAKTARASNNEELAVAYENKAESIQRLVDIVTTILKVVHEMTDIEMRDPKSRNKSVFNEIHNVVYSDARLSAFCSMPETKEQRLAREKQEEAQRLEQEAKKAAELEEREKTITAIIDKMMKVPHFEKMPADSVRRIAERVARKFSGSTPESRLKQASREKSGGEVKAENRQLGLALGMAGGFSTDELKALFPNAKQKKEKKQKR